MKPDDTFTIETWHRSRLLQNPAAIGFSYKLFRDGILLEEGGLGSANDAPFKTSAMATEAALHNIHTSYLP